MSIDWKARCAEHCGTIGNRDATIEELEAQLAESCEDMRSDYRVCPIAAKLEAQLAEATENVIEADATSNTVNDKWREAVDKQQKLEAQLEAVRGEIDGWWDNDDRTIVRFISRIKAAIGEES